MKDVDNASQTKTNVNVFSTVGGKARNTIFMKVMFTLDWSTNIVYLFKV